MATFAEAGVWLAKKYGPDVAKKFWGVGRDGSRAGELAQQLFRHSPSPPLKKTVNLHPEPSLAALCAEIARVPAGIYVCTEPSGYGKSTSFQLASSRVNGLKFVSPNAMLGKGDYMQAFLGSIGASTGTVLIFWLLSHMHS